MVSYLPFIRHLEFMNSISMFLLVLFDVPTWWVNWLWMSWRQPWERSTLEILLDEIEILCSFLWVCYYVFDANLEWRSSLGTFLNKLSNPDCSPHDLQEKISYFRVILYGLVIHQSDALPIQWHPNQIRFAQPFYSGKGVLKYFGLTVQLNLINKSLLTTNLILTLLHLASNIFALPKRFRSDALVRWSCQVLLQVINLILPVLKEHLISANRWSSNAWSWVYFITVLVSTVNMEKYLFPAREDVMVGNWSAPKIRFGLLLLE